MTVKYNKNVNDLAESIKGSYFKIIENFEYGTPKRPLGRISVVAIRKNRLDFYQVMDNRTLDKLVSAAKQLRLARKYLGQSGTEFIYTPRYEIESLENVLKEISNIKGRKHTKKRSNKNP